MALQLQQLPLALLSHSTSCTQNHPLFLHQNQQRHELRLSKTVETRLGNLSISQKRRYVGLFVGREDIELSVQEEEEEEEEEEDEEVPPSSQDLEYINEIKRVLELLKRNRDMLFNEVKLTIMIEDPREVERRRLLGIEDLDAPTRDDLVEALEQVNEGKVPKNRVARQMLAEEMRNWPNLEVEATKKKPSKSLYAKATETGVNLQEAAKRLKIDWDSAAEFQDDNVTDDTEVPPAVELYVIVFVSRYLDIFTDFISVYHTVMKLILLGSSISIVWSNHKIVRCSYDKDQDIFFFCHWLLLLLCFLLALVIHE